MNTKEQLATLLEQSGSEYLSGERLATQLGLTRAAIWKNIGLLTADGYEIESSRQGYRLGPNSDALSENSIRMYLGDLNSALELEVLSETDSTNSYLRNIAISAQHNGTLPALRPWHVVVASSQTAGRGRMGRTFVSPAGTGIYLSVLLRPSFDTNLAVRMTTAAAVAACQAIEACTDERPQIKWVNDVYVRNRKVCGILTEASINFETGVPDWVILGIGFNVYLPEGGFPPELKDIAGAITETRSQNLRSRIAAEFLTSFHRICSDLNNSEYSEEYKRRSFLLGQRIDVLKIDGPVPATAIDIDEECRLIVRYDDQSTEVLSSGEVSVRPSRG